MPPAALKSNLATTLRVLFFYICSCMTASRITFCRTRSTLACVIAKRVSSLTKAERQRHGVGAHILCACAKHTENDCRRYFTPVSARRYFMPPTALKSNLATTLRVLFFYICSRLTASSRAAYIKKQPYGCFARLFFRLVPAVGLEPTRMISPQDFESSASASFTTPAQE